MMALQNQRCARVQAFQAGAPRALKATLPAFSGLRSRANVVDFEAATPCLSQMVGSRGTSGAAARPGRRPHAVW